MEGYVNLAHEIKTGTVNYEIYASCPQMSQKSVYRYWYTAIKVPALWELAEKNLVFNESLSHEAEKLAEFKEISDQLPYRTEMVLEALKENNIELASIDAFSGRGGGLVSMKGGTYRINDLL